MILVGLYLEEGYVFGDLNVDVRIILKGSEKYIL